MFAGMRAKAFFRELKREVSDDNLGDVAAMMTYYAMFAVFPMLVFVLTIALLVIPQEVIREGVGMVSGAMPAQAAAILERHVLNLQDSAAGGLAIGSALLALWGASRGAVSLGRALNNVHDKKETRPWWKIQLTGIAVTLGVAILMIVALGLLAVGPLLGSFLADRFGLGSVFDVSWTIGRWIGAAVLVMFVWAILYKFLPNTQAPLRVFTLGAFIGVALWVGASLLFGIYVSNFGKYEATYGALGTIIVFLTWLWISNMALLFGAEVNDVLERDEKEAPEERTPARPRRSDPQPA
jgi:membrane protein